MYVGFCLIFSETKLNVVNVWREVTPSRMPSKLFVCGEAKTTAIQNSRNIGVFLIHKTLSDFLKITSDSTLVRAEFIKEFVRWHTPVLIVGFGRIIGLFSIVIWSTFKTITPSKIKNYFIFTVWTRTPI